MASTFQYELTNNEATYIVDADGTPLYRVDINGVRTVSLADMLPPGSCTATEEAEVQLLVTCVRVREEPILRSHACLCVCARAYAYVPRVYLAAR